MIWACRGGAVVAQPPRIRMEIGAAHRVRSDGAAKLFLCSTVPRFNNTCPSTKDDYCRASAEHHIAGAAVKPKNGVGRKQKIPCCARMPDCGNDGLLSRCGATARAPLM